MKGLRLFALVAAVFLSIAAVEASGWTFQGCWSPTAFGPCYDAYTDASGNYWRCDACGTTKNPSSHHCVQFNPSTGFWCS